MPLCVLGPYRLLTFNPRNVSLALYSCSIYLFIYFTALYSYCDTAVCNRKVFGVGIVLIYTQHLRDTKHHGSAIFNFISVVFVNYFELIVK